jgi:CHAT domain-containing protein
MAARQCSRLLVPLLTLVLISASAAAPNAEEAARAARTAIDRAQYDIADQIINDALQRFGAQKTDAVWALRVMRAEVLNKRGKYEDAQKALAEELPPALRNSAPGVWRYVQLAKSWWWDTKQVARYLDQAQRMATAHQPSLLGEVYVTYAALGPADHAEEYASKAIREARRVGDRGMESRAMAGPTFAFMRAGRYSDAVAWGEKILPLLKGPELARTLEATEGNLGWAYLELGNYDLAKELFTLAEADAGRIASESNHVSWLNQLGNLRYYERNLTAAAQYYEKVIAHGRPIKSRVVQSALANLAIVAIETGGLAEARRYNDEALTLKREAKDEDAVLRSLIINARIAAAAGDTNGAIATLSKVIKDATKAAQWEARGQLAKVLVKAKRYAEAEKQFRLAIDTVRDARRAITSDLRLSFYNTSADIFSAYLDFLVSQSRIKGALDATEEIRVDALDDALDEKTHSRAVDAREIAKQQNATILSYWLGPRHSYVWKITANEIRVVKLESDSTISTAVDAYRRELTGPRGRLELSRVRGQKLYELLGKPHGSRVIIIPDGSLHSINFETLVVPGPRPHYWIEDALVTEASSIRVLTQGRRVTNRPANLLLVGNPPSSDPLFPPLRYAGDEMRSIAKHFPSHARVLEGAAATADAYRSASPQQYDYVHFVAHGTASRTRPLESAVILAGGKLPARDVVKQKLAARLVTISSCHGAGARAYTAEGLVGLAWAFRRAGASSVIAALWEVNDSATPQLMDHFYEKTAAGVDPAAALRDAKLSLLNSGRAFRYARYWAPFVYYE